MPRKAPDGKGVIEHRITLGNFERKELVDAINAYQTDKWLGAAPKIVTSVAAVGAVGVLGVVGYALYYWFESVPSIGDVIDNLNPFNSMDILFDELDKSQDSMDKQALKGGLLDIDMVLAHRLRIIDNQVIAAEKLLEDPPIYPNPLAMSTAMLNIRLAPRRRIDAHFRHRAMMKVWSKTQAAIDAEANFDSVEDYRAHLEAMRRAEYDESHEAPEEAP